MVIAVKLRKIIVDGEEFLVPSHLKWQESVKRWVVVLQVERAAVKRNYTGFPALRHGGVVAAYIAAVRFLEKHHKVSETTIHSTCYALPNQGKANPSIAVGIDLATLVDRQGNDIHYFRVHVGSHCAGTLIRRSLRLGKPKSYTKDFYDMVYAKALETRVYLLSKHQELLQKQRRESNERVYKALNEFIASLTSSPV